MIICPLDSTGRKVTHLSSGTTDSLKNSTKGIGQQQILLCFTLQKETLRRKQKEMKISSSKSLSVNTNPSSVPFHFICMLESASKKNMWKQTKICCHTGKIQPKFAALCADLFYRNVRGMCLPYILQQPCSHLCFVSSTSNKSQSNNNDFYTDCSQEELEAFAQNITSIRNVCIHKGYIPCTLGCQKCYPIHKICVYELDQLGDLMHCPSGSHIKHCTKAECANMVKCYKNYCVPFR